MKMGEEKEKYWAGVTCPHCNHNIGWHLPKGERWVDQGREAVRCCVCENVFDVRQVPEYGRAVLAARFEKTGSLAKDVGGPTLHNLEDYYEDAEDGGDE